MAREPRLLERRRSAAVVALAVTVGAVGWLAAPARAYGTDESLLLTLTNTVRAANGVPGLTLDRGLSATARHWASSMAAAGQISHNPNLKSQVPSNWAKTGENVGYGATVEKIHGALLASPSHLRNIVDAQFELVGVGVVRADNLVWVVEIFFTPTGSSRWSADPEPAAEPEPPAEAEPAQEAAPEPAVESPPGSTATTAAGTAAPDATTTTTTLAPPTTLTLAAPTASGPALPLGLTLMVQQVRTLGING